ncbi:MULTISPECIES: retropepsin-like aspartic protease [unclassified Roseofilum]|uniref:retropepsin-like aspartic protease family protein n=1 Tax=unclassified Roseofilum TaxID=2620099 RepID=UPI000E904172|nr:MULTISPECIES: retropepsin-like aspartic protease [unclassified Roseofilum]MBP0009322.1 retroviral-like aspartic protease family protein [Roseofilum sp. Belize Diploria]MBP0033742.1 retroviral-like aspartic protease family protein [Roseofilum sp. Belize BBD 4]HBQ98276.1 aspartyl protease [Cyanobacteria bacterium UBA11691]
MNEHLWSKSLGMTVALGIGFMVSGAESAIAQEVQGCFMVTSSGQAIPLSGVCDGTSAPRSRPATPGVFQARIKRRLGGIPVIEVTFNDRHSFEMIVDTGASGTLITQEMAQKLQIEPVDSVTSTIADGSRVTFPLGYVKSIAVHGAVVRDIPVAIAPRMAIGLLGHDFFGNYDVQIKQNVVEFRPRS